MRAGGYVVDIGGVGKMMLCAKEYMRECMSEGQGKRGGTNNFNIVNARLSIHGVD
jgi:hypothetical protein